MKDLSVIEKEVIELAWNTGEFILTECENFDRTRVEQKTGINNLVSYVDKESERRLVKGLSKILPGSGFLAEEGTVLKGSNEYRWIIDPLDGTTNFTHGLPPFAISIGLSRNDEMVLGIVYEAFQKECFHSYEGEAAFCNEKIIHVSPSRTLEQSLLATGFPYDQEEKINAHLSIIRHFLTKTHGIRRLGSAATDLAYVACGRLDGFFEYNLSPWDVAAGSFLVHQAGGRVTDFRGGTNYLTGGELCAGNAIHGLMLEIITNHWG